jgi:Zn-dependent protease/CBS domain-containing protein
LSVKIGSLIGIPIILHYTWFFALILITWTLAVWYLPTQYPGLSVSTYWIIGAISAFLLLISVLIHEISHSYIAIKNNLPTSRIVLFIFGGVSQITEEPNDPETEFKVSVVGPLTSYFLAIIFGIIWYILKQIDLNQAILAPFNYLMIINGMLGTFNLLPAFPLDGGRLLRAGLWKRTKNLVKATAIATRVGIAFSYSFMVAGFIFMVFGAFINGIWLIFIGLFLKNGSESSMKQTIIGDALAGFKVSDVMTKEVHTIDKENTVNNVIETFLEYKHGGFPVVYNGKLVGFVTIQDVKKVPKENWEDIQIEQIMTPKDKLVTTTLNESVLDVMTKMSKYKIGRLPIVENGELLGIISRSDVMHIVKTKTELG